MRWCSLNEQKRALKNWMKTETFSDRLIYWAGKREKNAIPKPKITERKYKKKNFFRKLNQQKKAPNIGIGEVWVLKEFNNRSLSE